MKTRKAERGCNIICHIHGPTKTTICEKCLPKETYQPTPRKAERRNHKEIVCCGYYLVLSQAINMCITCENVYDENGKRLKPMGLATTTLNNHPTPAAHGKYEILMRVLLAAHYQPKDATAIVKAWSDANFKQAEGK